MYTRGEPGKYLFLHEHDVIEKGPEFLEQKDHVVQPTMHSTLGVYDICRPIGRYV